MPQVRFPVGVGQGPITRQMVRQMLKGRWPLVFNPDRICRLFFRCRITSPFPARRSDGRYFPADSSREVIRRRDARGSCRNHDVLSMSPMRYTRRRVLTPQVWQVKRWSGRHAVFSRPMYAPTPMLPAGATCSPWLFIRLADAAKRISSRAPPFAFPHACRRALFAGFQKDAESA